MTELLMLFGVEPTLTTGLFWRFVKAAVLIRNGAKSGVRGNSRQIEKDPPSKRKWAGLLKRDDPVLSLGYRWR